MILTLDYHLRIYEFEDLHPGCRIIVLFRPCLCLCLHSKDQKRQVALFTP